MPELNFTPEQRAAIDTRGSTVLVSAAAGSGKTRVLTERLMAYLTDAENPADIDRFLVITYTRAAAAELRSRILDGIYARIASDPENRRLRRQVALCARAEIGTIHSFCADFLRANCAALALAPDFYRFGLKMTGGLYRTSDNPLLVNRYYISRNTTLSTFASYVSHSD